MRFLRVLGLRSYTCAGRRGTIARAEFLADDVARAAIASGAMSTPSVRM